MKNKEYYKDEIYRVALEHTTVAVDKATNKPVECRGFNCVDCALKSEKRRCLDMFMEWKEQEHVESVLNDFEKEYLEAVLRPFKNQVKNIMKLCSGGAAGRSFIRIYLSMYDDTRILDYVNSPYFDGAKMYTGMEMGKQYTLEELRLFQDKTM